LKAFREKVPARRAASLEFQAMADQFPKAPKLKEPVVLLLMDGSVLEGHMFVDATSRIQDVLNSDLLFFPVQVTDEAGETSILILNKAAVRSVRPKPQGGSPRA
jgi:hypothetical protein